ncbi:MAG: 4Fe-4S binding protein [Clostridia bacterium]|nr:4Fe-4S binding protein [Clostridia bacterium]
MKLRQTLLCYFSPTGGTYKNAKAVADGIELPVLEKRVTLPADRKDALEIPEGSLVVLAAPVFGGRAPKLFTDYVKTLRGRGCPTLLCAVYGGRHYDMAFMDLYAAASTAGFMPFGCAALLAEHSFHERIQGGRPTAEDLKDATEIGARAVERLKAAEAPAVMPVERIPSRPVDLQAIGMHGEKLGGLSPNRPFPDPSCNRCGLCADVCPLGLIERGNPDRILEKCFKCGACVKLCPQKAMHFPQPDYEIVVQDCYEHFGMAPGRAESWF